MHICMLKVLTISLVYIAVARGRLGSIREDPVNANSSILSTDLIEHRIQGLEPNTQYRVVVYATTRIGAGSAAFLDMMTADRARKCPCGQITSFLLTKIYDKLMHFIMIVIYIVVL